MSCLDQPVQLHILAIMLTISMKQVKLSLNSLREMNNKDADHTARMRGCAVWSISLLFTCNK